MKSLKELRIERGMSQLDVCMQVGTSQVLYWKWETKRTRPSERFHPALERVFGVPIEEMDLRPYKKPGPKVGWDVNGQKEQEGR